MNKYIVIRVRQHLSMSNQNPITVYELRLTSPNGTLIENFVSADNTLTTDKGTEWLDDPINTGTTITLYRWENGIRIKEWSYDV